MPLIFAFVFVFDRVFKGICKYPSDMNSTLIAKKKRWVYRRKGGLLNVTMPPQIEAAPTIVKSTYL